MDIDDINIQRKKIKRVGIVINWIKKRIDNNKNFIGIFNGETGSGKTYAAMDLALRCSRAFESNFTLEDNMGFTFDDLRVKMRLPQNKKKGTVFLFEEVGAFGSGAAASEWQAKAAKFFNSFLQTSRHRNQILLFTCPDFGNLALSSRKLCHMQFIAQAINPKSKESFFTPYRLQINPTSGKIYSKYLRYSLPDQKVKRRHKREIFKLPPKDMCIKYERLKTEFTDRLDREMDIQQEEAKAKKKKSFTKADLAWNLHEKGIRTIDIAQMLDISDRMIRYYIEEKKKEGKPHVFKLINNGRTKVNGEVPI